jgi:hypothetical protein
VDAERDQTWLYPFARTRFERGSPREERTLGIWFDGTTAEGESYGGLFPLWGGLRDRLGMDRIDFALWPLWARGARAGYHETQVLWPIFAFGRGDGRFKLRVWPLFGIERHEGVFSHRFALWPFLHWRRDRLDSETPSRAFYFFPLYGRRDSGPRWFRFYLLPLYAHQGDSERPEAGRVDVVWPIFSWARQSNGEEWIALRPLYSRRRNDAEIVSSFGLGLFGRARLRNADVEQNEWRLLWAGRLGRRLELGREMRRADLWPLYRWQQVTEADGSESGFTRVPYLLPMRGLDPDGWDRHYNKLFELYGARWRDRERRSSWLFGLLETRTRPDSAWTSLGGLAHLELTARPEEPTSLAGD